MIDNIWIIFSFNSNDIFLHAQPPFHVKFSCHPPFLNKMCFPLIFVQSWLHPPKLSAPPSGCFWHLPLMRKK